MKAAESYDRVAREYAERMTSELEHKPFDRAMLGRFANLVHAAAPTGTDLPVLDVGCGPGHVARFLHGLGVSVIGIDLSAGMIAEARRLNPDLEFRVGDMRSLDWPNASIGAIVAPYSIIHIPRDEIVAVLREFDRVLIPGGTVLLSYHVGNETRHFDEWWDQKVDLDFLFFETEEMDRYLRDAGFCEIETTVRDPYPDVEVQTRRAYVLASR